MRANGLNDIRTKALEIVKRYTDRIGDFDAARLDMAAKSLRYGTMREAVEAARAGRLSKEDLSLHILYFGYRLKQQREKGPRKRSAG